MVGNSREQIVSDIPAHQNALHQTKQWELGSEKEYNYYENDDIHEETTTCSTMFSRKNDPLKSIGCSEERSVSSFLRRCNSFNEKDDSVLGCVTPPSMSRPSSWSTFDELVYTEAELEMVDGDEPTQESDLRPTPEHHRNFWVVTTAAMPWMTGTAVNPLLRAAHLSRLNRPYTDKNTVTLVLPWLESAEERAILYGPDWEDKTQSDQEIFIRMWLAEEANLPLEADPDQGGIKIVFYPARYLSAWGSIFATGDICSWIPDGTADVCFLEEPEHLNFFAQGKHSWTDKFRHVIGIVHTNYKAYASSHYSGILSTPVIGVCCSVVFRASCHKVIKLSPVLQTFALEKEVVCNVHGVRKEFLEEGRRRSRSPGKSGVYFVGKLLWAKGFDKMLSLQEAHRKIMGDYFPIDIYGSGPEETEIRRAFRGHEKPLSVGESMNTTDLPSHKTSKVDLKEVLPIWRRQSIPANFLGRKDHAALTEDYKVFINPSISEVLCTTTAEAIAMGKFVLIPVHPSNTFFLKFPNCLQYNNKLEFVALLQHALSHEPEPLTHELAYHLTWEAATERCLVASVITKRDQRRGERAGQAKRDERAAKLHHKMNTGIKGTMIRRMMGAGNLTDLEMLKIGVSAGSLATDTLV